MDRSQLLFTVVDIFCQPFQNYRTFKNVERLKGTQYCDADPKYCRTDFYYDKNRIGKEKLPILVNVHGGGFVKGGKGHRRSLCEFYANEGWFVICPDYRLAPKYPFPAAMHDIQTVLNRLPEWAESFLLDLSTIVLTGDSAGAYYAAETAAAMTNETLRVGLGLSEYDVKLSALMPFSGVYDLEKAISKKLPFGITRVIGTDIVGIKLDKDFGNLKDYPLLPYFSTTNYVTESFPKTFLSYAKKDFFVGGQGEEFVKKLKEKNVPHSVDSTTSFFENHCYYLTFFTRASKRCMGKVKTFLAEIKENRKP